MESVERALRNPAERRTLSLERIAAVTWDREPGEVATHGVLIGTRLWPMRHLIGAALGVGAERVGNVAGLKALDRLGLRTFSLVPYEPGPVRARRSAGRHLAPRRRQELSSP
ncbi:hypothetical protein [Kitasatospora sp. NPDC001527]|uniref:hypothetical protein n=1 Tax=Kitasatospora sp. NPDC001527 TaxID=3154519 RepID=UPI00332E5FE9